MCICTQIYNLRVSDQLDDARRPTAVREESQAAAEEASCSFLAAQELQAEEAGRVKRDDEASVAAQAR